MAPAFEDCGKNPVPFVNTVRLGPPYSFKLNGVASHWIHPQSHGYESSALS